ncbi:MAG: glycosyltransferase [Asticcacaulis sp.]|nr:glycosyltransferase [Asticcacaulis sp.]
MRTAERDRAALILFCFEAPNWFNEVSPHKRPEAGWREWQLPVRRGGLVLCSAEENRRYAEAYFTDVPPETQFDVWQPAINTPARDRSDDITHQKKILLFARPSDKHKGADVVEHLMVPELRDHVFSIVIGNPRGAGIYRSRISMLAAERGLSVEFLFSLSDEEKFAAIKSASAMVFPSFFEGYGYPPVEALACDTACVAYDLPVIRENVGDLVRYAPLGDIDALREALIETVRQPRQETALNPRIRFLTDIDQRADALEQVIARYLHHLAQPSAPDGVSIGEASSLIFGDRTVIQFTLASRVRILGALSSAEWIRSCWVEPGYWHEGELLHTVVLSGRTREMTDLAGSILSLSFAGGRQGQVTLDINLCPPKPLADFADNTFGISQIIPVDQARLVSAWAMPPAGIEYDAVVWLAQRGEALHCVAGDTAYVNNDYKARTGIGEQTSCGLLFRFDHEADLTGRHAVLLLRNGRVVAAGNIPAVSLPKARGGESALLSLEGTNAARIVRLIGEAPESRAAMDSGGIFRARADAGDNAVRLELYRQQIRLGFPLGNPQLYAIVNPDRVEGDEAEFRLLLPALDNRKWRYKACLRTFRAEISEAITPLLEYAQDVVDLPAKTLVLNTEDTTTNAAFTVIRRPLRRAVSRYVYDAVARQIHVSGWVLTEASVRAELVDDTSGEIVAYTTRRTERADVAKRHADGTFVDYGFEIDAWVGELPQNGIVLADGHGMNEGLRASEAPEFSVGRISEAGYLLRVFTGAGETVEWPIGLPVLHGVTEFCAFDSRYDSSWDLLWIRGVFVASGHRLSSIEAWQGDRLLGEGAVNIKQYRHGETNTGWRFELLLDAPLDTAVPIDIRATLENGARVSLSLAVPEASASAAPPPVLPGGDLVRYGAEAAKARLFSVLPPPARPRVLLIIHNLDAVDRPEKAQAIASLRDELRRQGRELVVLHHSPHAIPSPRPAPPGRDQFL